MCVLSRIVCRQSPFRLFARERHQTSLFGLARAGAHFHPRSLIIHIEKSTDLHFYIEILEKIGK